MILLLVLVSFTLAARVNVLETGVNLSQVEYVLGEYHLEELGSHIKINAPQMQYPITAGAPELPFEEFKIALPPSGSIVWNITVLAEEQLSLNHRLQPVPKLIEAEDGMSQNYYQIDEKLYAKLPSSYIKELEPDSFRGYSFTTLRISPFKYDGNNGLSILKHALISINIMGDTAITAKAETDPLAEVFLSSVINPNQASSWQNQSTRAGINHAHFYNADYWLRIEVEEDGIYQLTKQNLSSLPLEDIDPRSFRIFGTGGAVNASTVVAAGPEFAEIPIRVIGEEDGSFDASDKIIFYAENRDGLQKTKNLSAAPTVYNPYSQNGVYWLTFGGNFPAPPSRMPGQASLLQHDLSLDSHLTYSRMENENHRIDNFGFDWYSSKLFGKQTADYSYTLNISNLVENDEGKSLTIRFRQEDTLAYNTHRIKVWVNEEEVPPPAYADYFSWLGSGYYTLTANNVHLIEGDNQIRIRVLRPDGTDNLFLDYIHIGYTQLLKKPAGQFFFNSPQVKDEPKIAFNIQGDLSNVEIYRIDSLHEVKQIYWHANGNTFTALGNGTPRYVLTRPSEYLSPASISVADPQDLTLNTSPVDHIIISPKEFISQASSLAGMYQEFYGLRVRVVDQQDIFNQFNGGHPDPFALRQYLRYAYFNFDLPKLQGVTLIGLGTLDWRNKSHISAAKNKLIVYLQDQTTSDDYFAMMQSSSRPELIIGRYPVRNTAELNIMLSNYRNYVQNPSPGWWRNSMVFLADDLYNGSQQVTETSHTTQMEGASQVLHKSIAVDKIFAWEYDYDEYQNKPAARDDMIAAINDGRLVWYYIGHGSYDSMGSEDYFNGATDLRRLNNTGKQPLFIASSCKISEFDHWGFDSLGQKLVLMENMGAIASFSATRMSGGSANTFMVEKLLNAFANKRNPLGKSIMEAKLISTYDGNDAFFVLLGDPTLRVTPPIRDSLMSVNGSDASVLLRSREQPSVQGSLATFTGNGTATLRFIDSDRNYVLGSYTNVSQQGKTLFKGDVSVNGGSYQGAFIVPDDITNGDTASIVSYLWDDDSKQDYLNYFYPVSTSNNAVPIQNDGPPKIELFVGTMDFRAGDTVPTSTTLLAKISDANGINITDSAGHHIFLVIDDAIQPLAVTEYFSYDKDSFTQGLLRYPLPKLSEGAHSIQLIAFDNFNLPAVANTQFIAKHSSDISIQRVLIYPNPMRDDAQLTFILNRDASLDIGIYTITGKRVRRIQSMAKEGFNQIPIDAKDSQGKRLANNTYFIKIKASSSGKHSEATERLVIYK